MKNRLIQPTMISKKFTKVSYCDKLRYVRSGKLFKKSKNRKLGTDRFSLCSTDSFWNRDSCRKVKQEKILHKKREMDPLQKGLFPVFF